MSDSSSKTTPSNTAADTAGSRGIASTTDSALERSMNQSCADFSTPIAPKRPAAADRPARRRTDAISPGERRITDRDLEDRAKSRNDGPLESLGKAITSPIIEAADEGDKKR